jgi:uncharacterized membrane protein
MARKFLVITTFAVFSVALLAISLYRYALGQLFYYDFGIFAHTIWQLSRFEVPYIDHIVLGHIVFLGDHFNPGLILFAPLFWITSDIRILLLEQALALVIAGIFVYKIARHHALSPTSALAVSSAYLIFAGAENPLVTDWHPEPTAAVFLLAFIYFYSINKSKRNQIVAYLSALIFILLKESNAVSFVFALIPLFFLNKQRRIETILLAAVAYLYFLAATKLAIPHFAHRDYMYSPQFPSSPFTLLTNMVNAPAKTKLLYEALISFGFLPLFSIGALTVVLELAVRLAPTSTIFNNLTLGQHYNVFLGVFLAFATILSIKNIKTVVSKITKTDHSPRLNLLQISLAIYLLVASLYTARKITGSPINLAINKTFWHELTPNKHITAAIQKVPKEGSVMSQNNLLAYLANRSENLYTPFANYEKYSPDTIIFDVTENQNPNNFYPADTKIIKDILTRLEKDPNYTKISSTEETIYIYRKKAK